MRARHLRLLNSYKHIDITFRVTIRFSSFLSFVKLRHLSILFFFFQAEDGIRDYKVTGVQTCALPIFTHVELEIYITEFDVRDDTFPDDVATRDTMIAETAEKFLTGVLRIPAVKIVKIGRASCRERV